MSRFRVSDIVVTRRSLHTHSDYLNLVKEAWNRDDGGVIYGLNNVGKDSIVFNVEVKYYCKEEKVGVLS